MRKHGRPGPWLTRSLVPMAVLILVVVALAAHPAVAGVLTSGSYTYILKGRDLEVPVDITTVQGATLVPAELLRSLGIAPAVAGDVVRLERGPVKAELTLGSRAAQVDGKRQVLPAAPMLVGERLFVPAAILGDLGFGLEIDGKFVLLTDYGDGNQLNPMPEDLYNQAVAAHSLQSTLRTDASAFAEIRITLLTRNILADGRTDLPWGTRVRLLALSDTQTLMMVTIKNTSARSVALDPLKLLVTGENGRQYDYTGSQVALDGNVTAPVAPGATRLSLLAYNQVEGPVTLYYDVGATQLGRVEGP